MDGLTDGWTDQPTDGHTLIYRDARTNLKSFVSATLTKVTIRREPYFTWSECVTSETFLFLVIRIA